MKTGAVKPYQQERINVILDPENADRRGIGYHTWQSILTVGEGGLFGSRASVEHSQSGLKFLPEPHTDFIFSIIGEELGFIGAAILIAMFGFLAWRGFRIAQLTSDRFVFYGALGLTLMIAMQALINFSVALCLLPTKGIALPLVSYGGSSLISSLIAIGILLNFSQQAN
ncbi:MAG TPA: FtsW/RodA/SpoVE family cell cycle protein [Thermoanaerobaculia bacterium]